MTCDLTHALDTQAEYRRVQEVCARLGIACHKFDYVKEYWNFVFSDVLARYVHINMATHSFICKVF